MSEKADGVINVKAPFLSDVNMGMSSRVSSSLSVSFARGLRHVKLCLIGTHA